MRRLVPCLAALAASALVMSACGDPQTLTHPSADPAPVAGPVHHAAPVLKAIKANALDTSSDPVIAAAGDIACNSADEAAALQYNDNTVCQEAKTAALLQDPAIGSVLALGDDQYYAGDIDQFSTMYDKSWGTVFNKTYPVPGNHEYYGNNANGEGYFAYFGNRAGPVGKGWYSYDIGAWHLIALNTGSCVAIGGCSPAFAGHAASEQYTWLVNDLAQHPNQCTLAYWHHPVFSGGGEGGTKALSGFFSALYNAQADVILNGHDHDYERFAEQDSLGQAQPDRGVREFIVGTGGRSHEDFSGPTPPNTEARFNDSFGVLKMTLHATSYDWQFLDAAGSTSGDSGSATCHVVTPTVTAPALVLRGQPLVVSGTGRVATPLTLHVASPAGTQDLTPKLDATGAWTTTLPTTPGGGPYTLTATSGTQVSTPVVTTMNGTTITGPASAPRGGTIVLSGLSAPGRTVTVYVTRPDAKPYAIKTIAGAEGTYSVTAPVGAAAGWYAVSNSYRTPEGHSLLHGVTVAGPKAAKAGTKVVLSGIAGPRAKVVVFTHSYHGKSTIGHAVRADARGAYRFVGRFAVSSIWWATSAGSRSPTHTTVIAKPPPNLTSG